MSLETRGQARPSLAFVAGSSSLAVGSASALMAAVLVAMAITIAFGLLQGVGRSLKETLFGPVLLLIWSHGLEPQPTWNHPPTMFSAIAGSPRVYALPALALVLGLLGRWLAGRGMAPGAETRLARAALRYSRGGIFLGGFAAVLLFGLLVVSRLV